MPPETLRTLLDAGRRVLARQGVETAALDARLLLQRACGTTHEALVCMPETAATDSQAQSFRAMVARREGGEPVSRILGEREFYGRFFAVTQAVLDPRPETETLIDEILARCHDGFRFADLGTGSGAIAVTLACERPLARGVAVDVSAEALNVAQANAERHGVAERLAFVQANWLNGIAGEFDLIVANPPYIRHDDIAALAREVRQHDPLLALDGGADGLAAYRAIAAQARAALVIVEIGAGQADKVATIFAAGGYRLEAARQDLAGHPRCLALRRH